MRFREGFHDPVHHVMEVDGLHLQSLSVRGTVRTPIRPGQVSLLIQCVPLDVLEDPSQLSQRNGPILGSLDGSAGVVAEGGGPVVAAKENRRGVFGRMLLGIIISGRPAASPQW